MFRLVVFFALSVLVVLASLTAFGSVGAWTAGVVLAAIAAMWVPRGLPLPGAVMILLLVVPAASMVSPVRYAQDAARQAWCGTGQLRLAIENYHDWHGIFPPAFIFSRVCHRHFNIACCTAVWNAHDGSRLCGGGHWNLHSRSEIRVRVGGAEAWMPEMNTSPTPVVAHASSPMPLAMADCRWRAS